MTTFAKLPISITARSSARSPIQGGFVCNQYWPMSYMRTSISLLKAGSQESVSLFHCVQQGPGSRDLIPGPSLQQKAANSSRRCCQRVSCSSLTRCPCKLTRYALIIPLRAVVREPQGIMGSLLGHARRVDEGAQLWCSVLILGVRSIPKNKGQCPLVGPWMRTPTLVRFRMLGKAAMSP